MAIALSLVSTRRYLHQIPQRSFYIALKPRDVTIQISATEGVFQVNATKDPFLCWNTGISDKKRLSRRV